MKKLSLALDDLRVTSFQTTDEGPDGEGTVHGLEGYTPECPGYGCTDRFSTCEYPTAVHHNCAPDYTYEQPQCWQMQPQTYYCFGGETYPQTGGGGQMC
jgi:hypothetical protein